ncbi:MAG: bifunctional methylenetetrahydrofolate dehydrogenase/methenyltetrahydrofolate cyclohydrolase [Betaproteobacteria bacterium]|nr:bifunctional methylenetetrahydrofolate dehydrogenase/methenyltetrahydrofolate cyclohydrolase [Betaproteobacteria bacterium]
MSARLIDGKAHAASLRTELKPEVERLAGLGLRPGLAVIVVGDNPASRAYVRNKVRACEDTGVRSELHEFSADVTEAALLERIAALNADAGVHGILVQLPLPAHIPEARLTAAISPAKDVDGFRVENAGALLTGLLLQKDATVTICHSRTPDLQARARDADILVAAVGKAKLIVAEMVKPGACVIDVGINRLPDGRLVGDVDFDAVRAVAGSITPVPGGVGPMTVAMLVSNTVQAAQRHLQERA